MIALQWSLFVLSAATMALELVQLRIFAYSLPCSISHIIISLALLGMGAGGLSAGALKRFDLRRLLVALSLGEAVSAIIVHVIFARTSTLLGQSYMTMGRFAIAAPILALPYAFYGAATAAMFSARVIPHERLVASNLVGSAVGVVLPLVCIATFGAPIVLCFVAAIAVLAAFIASPSRWQLVVLAIIGVSSSALTFSPKPDSGLERSLRTAGAVREVSTWDPLGRIEVYRFAPHYGNLHADHPLELRMLFQDGDASSSLLNLQGAPTSWSQVFRGSIYALVYQLRHAPDVLTIGLGGGADIQMALAFSAKTITGVEINRTTVGVVRDRYADFVGHPYQQPSVKIVNADGRSFAHTATDRYDIVQIVGADTDTPNLTAGALAVSENYLYTKEAIRDYVHALRDDGVLSIMRFGGREPMVVLSAAIAALRSLGVADPSRHFLVINQAASTNILLFKQPVKPLDDRNARRILALINSMLAPNTSPLSDLLGFPVDGEAKMLWSPVDDARPPSAVGVLLEATQQGTEADVIAKAPSFIEPLTDDRPFFYQYEKRETLFVYKNSVLYALLVVAAIAVAILVVALLVVVASRRSRVRTAIGFASLGAAFTLVELCLIQKSALFLGHPTYAFATMTLALLGFAALGSVIAPRSIASVLIAIIAATLGYRAWLPAIYDAVLPHWLPLRLVVAGLVMAPLFTLMGMPFSRALRSVIDDPIAPLVGLNALASVVGATIALPLAMLYGFGVVLYVASAVYALALVMLYGGDG